MTMIIDGTNGGFFPSWTTAGRPASPAVGQMGYNSTVGKFDAYSANGWGNLLSTANPQSGGVIQVVTGFYNVRIATASTGSYIDTGLTASITPQFSTSKILIIGVHADSFKNNQDASQSLYIQLQRNGSTILQVCDRALLTVSAIENMENIAFTYLDSPATTSSTTYKTVFKAYAGTGFVSVQQQSSSYSNIMLLEIAA